jgi:putative acetyltransferase
MLIRSYRNENASTVRELFVRVNRELAPPELRDDFERYITIALRDEIDRIPEYYRAGPGRGFWIAEDESGALMGFFGLEPAGQDGAELRRMYVVPESRRRGVARTMLVRAEHICVRAGLKRLVLSTSALQDAALALYHGSGYRLVGEEVAGRATNKTVGAGLRRFQFEKALAADVCDRRN